ncbi:spore germination protein [Paraliobacillus quinghaiensis]|uniref:Spore germination protein n=1 Tax=Paraliobacillus quinghaiensis TaxID=470815 RepID=A0A917TIA5_9BACI|nr:spore germination protein [Paraliobacillus quinghaiensis]GGM24199.1 spore germination protein [Paraliobacillus quinghaiensis]
MVKRLKLKQKKAISSSKQNKNKQQSPPEPIAKDLDKNVQRIKQNFKKSADVSYRDYQVYNGKTPINVFMCFIDGLVKEDSINSFAIKPLMEPDFLNKVEPLPNDDFFKEVKDRIISTSSMKEANTIDDVVNGVLSGATAIFIDGYASAFLIKSIGFESRNVQEPQTEASVRGPREGFNEVLNVNSSLIRRKIKNKNLIFEDMEIGKETKTVVRIGYIEGIANTKVVEEVKQRLKRIDTDSILESGYIEQFIEDHPYSIFPTIGNSEKPDKVAAKIVEGRIAIFCDGTPFVLTVPHVFIEALQVPEDYYSRPYLASLLRMFRVLALFLTIGTPAIFVSVATFHHEMVPALLLTTMAAAQEKVPFPTFLEALLMTIVFELLREAGVRLPRPVGSAISIVGALVIGEAAVTAGLVSAPMVIVVALTAITGFVVTALNDAIILMRFILLFMAGAFGFYGVLIATFIMLAHLSSLRSFGTPYLTPIAPVILSEWKDAIIRMPLWLLHSRPQTITWKKSERQGTKNKPQRPKGRG